MAVLGAPAPAAWPLWTIAAGHLAAWYPASVPFQGTSVRGFAVKAGGKILVTVKAG
jgi:hypothetical protein